jgi:hypothetical protein
MNIDPLSNSGFIPPSRRNGSFSQRADENSSGGGFDQLSTELSNSVRNRLASLPEARPEVVARGRELAADPTYPGQDIVRKIASLITPLSEF